MGFDSKFFVTGSNGEIQKLPACYGFALLPGKSASASRIVVPGSFPVQVRIRGRSDLLDIPNSGAWYLSERIESWDVVGTIANEGWCVVTFDSPEGGARLDDGKALFPCTVQDPGTAILQAAPVDGGVEGWALRPGDKGLQFIFDGVPRDVDFYAQSLSGKWVLAERIIASTDTWPALVYRDVKAPIGRLYLRAGGAGATVGIDKVNEVG